MLCYICIYCYIICNLCYRQDGVLPAKVRFDWARPVFYAFWDDRMATSLVSKTQNPKPQNLNLT